VNTRLNDTSTFDSPTGPRVAKYAVSLIVKCLCSLHFFYCSMTRCTRIRLGDQIMLLQKCARKWQKHEPTNHYPLIMKHFKICC